MAYAGFLQNLDNHNIHHKSNTNLQPYSQINHKSSTHTLKSTTNLQPIPTNQTQMNLISNSHFHELFIPKNQIEKHQLHNLFIPINQIKKSLNPYHFHTHKSKKKKKNQDVDRRPWQLRCTTAMET